MIAVSGLQLRKRTCAAESGKQPEKSNRLHDEPKKIEEKLSGSELACRINSRRRSQLIYTLVRSDLTHRSYLTPFIRSSIFPSSHHSRLITPLIHKPKPQYEGTSSSPAPRSQISTPPFHTNAHQCTSSKSPSHLLVPPSPALPKLPHKTTFHRRQTQEPAH